MELLVVITIIAILSTVAYMALGGQTAKARDSRRVQDLGTIQSALEIYFIENGNKYPDVLATGLVPKYMPKLPTDPSSPEAGPVKNYLYDHDGTFKTYQLSATLETETTPFVKAYVTGNSTTDLLTGVKPDGTGCALPGDVKVKDASITCIPYTL